MNRNSRGRVEEDINVARHKFTGKDRKKSASATKKYYAKQQAFGHVVTQKDCKLIDEACHRFWVKRGGMPKVNDDILFGSKARSGSH